MQLTDRLQRDTTVCAIESHRSPFDIETHALTHTHQNRLGAQRHVVSLTAEHDMHRLGFNCAPPAAIDQPAIRAAIASPTSRVPA
ncbi:hypothetical protein [Burkholderia sp. JKS000303]|uniref:hypothetical protein n=1 Tax=Burkholderia sp. JKS000303 TaxID=1938747 RepID=UPI000BF5D855|nr:hypothetical protein [Burkholderia sp. JKS000303]